MKSYIGDIMLILGLVLLVTSSWEVRPIFGMFSLSFILIGFGYLGVRRG